MPCFVIEEIQPWWGTDASFFVNFKYLQMLYLTTEDWYLWNKFPCEPKSMIIFSGWNTAPHCLWLQWWGQIQSESRHILAQYLGLSSGWPTEDISGKSGGGGENATDYNRETPAGNLWWCDGDCLVYHVECHGWNSCKLSKIPQCRWHVSIPQM